MEILGQTIDDAAGEAIDKCSKVMGLGYPADRLSTGLPAREILKPLLQQTAYSRTGLQLQRLEDFVSVFLARLDKG